MGRIPITIEKIKIESSGLPDNEIREKVRYLFKLTEKGNQWERTFICDRDDLLKLRNEINKLIELTTTAEVLRITDEKAKIIDDHYSKDPLCKECNYKLTHNCKECLFILQSPLERKLYIELIKNFIKFTPQYPLNWNGYYVSLEGKLFSNKDNNFKDVLTVVDFYIESKGVKLCVYTDGHTYHERTEEQAQKDRNIDRKLQELGFQVLRYTGKDVKENTQKIIEDIKRWMY